VKAKRKQRKALRLPPTGADMDGNFILGNAFRGVRKIAAVSFNTIGCSSDMLGSHMARGRVCYAVERGSQPFAENPRTRNAAARSNSRLATQISGSYIDDDDDDVDDYCRLVERRCAGDSLTCPDTCAGLMIGKHTVNVAPCPFPSLATVMTPP